MSAVATDGVSLHWRPLQTIGEAANPDALALGSVAIWRLAAARGDRRWREIIAAYLGIPAAALVVENATHGKPQVVGGGVQFNLSHSHGQTVVGVSRELALGVDIEHYRPLTWRAQLLRRCFTAAEQAVLAGADDRRILRWWSGKEALVKAHGRGIAYGLDRIELRETADGVIGLHALQGPAGPATRWSLRPLPAQADYVGMLAIEGAPRRIECFALAPDVSSDQPGRDAQSGESRDAR